MVILTGNTYPVKEQLKALGARWDTGKKAWLVPDDKADDARKLVAGAPTATGNKHFHRTTCIICGAKEGKRNSRGYIGGTRILRSGECSDCYEERKMGY